MKRTYQIIVNDEGNAHAIKCFNCGMTSYHPKDVSNRFCGMCHIFHEDLRQLAKLPKFLDVLMDSEMALNPKYLEALGIDPDVLTGDTTYSTQEAALGILNRETD